MGNVAGGRGGTGGGKHLNLGKYEIVEASLDSNLHAHLVLKRGGRWVGPCSSLPQRNQSGCGGIHPPSTPGRNAGKHLYGPSLFIEEMLLAANKYFSTLMIGLKY